MDTNNMKGALRLSAYYKTTLLSNAIINQIRHEHVLLPYKTTLLSNLAKHLKGKRLILGCLARSNIPAPIG